MEQHIVINDLLNYLSCKQKLIYKDNLLKIIKGFYSDKDILDAKKVLVDILPSTKSTLKARNSLKNNNTLFGLYDCLNLLPSSQCPFFVCCNLNNIPVMNEHDELADEQELTQNCDFKDQQKEMEEQLSEISDTVKELQNQMEKFSHDGILKRPGNDYILQQNKKPTKKAKFSHKIGKSSLQSTGKGGLAHLQKLIDEEADKSEGEENFVSVEEDPIEYSDWEDDLELASNVIQQELNRVGEDSKVIIVSPNFESKVMQTRTVPLNLQTTPTKIVQPESSMEVSSSSDCAFDKDGIIRSEIKADASLSTYGKLSEMKRPYIIVENGFDENIGNFLVYRCSLCNFASNDENSLPSHECNIPDMVQSEHQRYTCKFCEFEADHAKHLNDHLGIHKKIIVKRKYQCVLCHFDSDDSDTFKNHLRSHTWKRPYRCGDCDFKVNDQTKLKKHSLWHVEYRTSDHYECFLCDKVCGSSNALEKHKSMHSRNLDYECSYCGISYHTESKLYTHVLTHTKERSFVCKYCDHATDSLHYLMHHEAGHLKDKKSECHICGEIFMQKSALRFHIQSEHIDYNSYKCDICYEGFATASDARMHRKKAHEDIVRLMCPHCKKIYKDEVYYNMHLEMHRRGVEVL